MALPSSGPLSINDIGVELGASSTNQSLGTFSDTAGFTNPDRIADFYGWIKPGLYGPIYTQNLSTSNVWSLVDEDISSIYDGKTCRLAIHYTNGTTSTSYRGDFQVGANVTLGQSNISFASSMTNWETTRNNQAANAQAYDAATFYTLADGTTSQRWNRRNTSAPPSGGTGLAPGSGTPPGTSYYAYTETSGASATMLGFGFWFRTPQVTLAANNNTFEISIAHYGSNVGTFSVFLDLIVN
tara:strand:- start:908 stop:1630 length:723 start_codon:yes stop_codon:yes gene_type:complete